MLMKLTRNEKILLYPASFILSIVTYPPTETFVFYSVCLAMIVDIIFSKSITELAFDGDIRGIGSIIEQGNVNIIDNVGKTALMSAGVKGNTIAARILINNGADINIQDNDGMTALLWAAKHGNTEIVQLLINNGADINIQDKGGKTTLMFAAQHRNTEIVQLLIYKGADINAQNKNGNTPLMVAAAYGNTETVNLLLDKGADIHTKDNNGYTALNIAANTAFITRKVLFNSNFLQNNEDDTPLVMALGNRCFETVQLLVNKGADVNVSDIHGERPRLGYSSYCISKATLDAVTKSLAIELAPEIRVNSVAPGAIIWADSEETEERTEALSFTPLKRTGEPLDIGKAVLYLAESAYVTGQILRVDGGRALNV